ncbi:hypothetical protein [Haloarcula argentinensis]|uniref:DUF7282 domain-containing protein n=1 Tax=Haloarcula argentinensis TaxID=43776 RepID=A0A830FX98_HALAR|nr:hypothetical protein [Haloarcula argentinensis]GGM50205.1 hypothetical protein GCM10009006_34250 [Haloarcula argentinensis]
MKAQTVIVVIITAILIGTVPMTVSGDDWPDAEAAQCTSETEIIGEGSYSGTFDARGETDTYKLDLSSGGPVNVDFSTESSYPEITYGSEAITIDNADENADPRAVRGGWRVTYNGDGATASWRIYPEEDTVVCVRMSIPSDATFPIDWSLDLDGELATPTPTPESTPTPEDSGGVAEVSLPSQDSTGTQVIVNSAVVSEGGYIALHKGSAAGPVVGHSGYLEAGSHREIMIPVDQPLSRGEHTIVAMPHLDTDDNMEYNFPSADEPYTSAGDPVTDSATVTSFNEDTPTPTATPTPTPTPTIEPTQQQPTDTEDALQDTDGDGVIDSEDYAPRDPDVQRKSDVITTTGGSGPGFGFGITVLSALIVGVLTRQRS